mgnify:CR=1 FL=1
MSRAMAVIDTLAYLKNSCNLNVMVSEEKVEILAWLVELLQAFFLMADDVMDDSTMRRGKPCWFRVENVGKTAINDSLLLQSILYRVLRLHFSSYACYGRLVEEFLNATFITELGQLMDMSKPIDGFSRVYYQRMVCLKTAYYSFVLPVKLAFTIFDIDGFPKELESGLLKIGEFFQIQDDYLDVYGDPAITGKEGTDIQEGKCTWLALEILERANDKDLLIFSLNIGKSDGASVDLIKGLYMKYEIEKVYQTHEQEYEEQLSNIDCPHKHILQYFLKKILKRNK